MSPIDVVGEKIERRLDGIVTLTSGARLLSSLSPDFGAGEQAHLAFPDSEPPATDPQSIP
jgi:hypothetical protein